MDNIICYLCKVNLSFQKYEGTKLLDDNGDKPCFECLIEAGAFDDEDVQLMDVDDDFG